MNSPESLRRWRLLLGAEPAAALGISLSTEDARMDDALEALYDAGRQRGGLGGSNPKIARWLGDIRRYFPSEVVQVMQQDAIDRLDLKQLLLEPEVLAQAEPDVHLVGTLLSLNRIIPAKTRETARMGVRKLVDQLLPKLEQPTRQAIQGSLSRSLRNRRPRINGIDWHRTIRANLETWQHEHRTIIPETLIGDGRCRIQRDTEINLSAFGELADLRDETLRIDALVAAEFSAIGRMSNV